MANIMKQLEPHRVTALALYLKYNQNPKKEKIIGDYCTVCRRQ
jgi:hypothetical protein